MSISNQHTGSLATKAQQELEVMRSLRDMPMTPTELCVETGLAKNRVSLLLQGLYEANCIKKVPGTHIVALISCR
jgi:DNA-binding IclR family transcriptional regulator